MCRDIERWEVNEVQIPGKKIEPQWPFLDTLDCSRATGVIQPVHDAVMQGFVDGLQLGLHATCPAQDVS
jgi:hypothetical protein